MSEEPSDFSAPPPAMQETACGRRCIALVGPMGAGKTTVGRELARKLGCAFIDCDLELEQRLGVRVSTVFEIEGEAGFRVREHRLLAELVHRRDTVLATGGGVVLREENRALLHQHCLVAYLKILPSVLWERLRHDRTRPLLQVPNPRAKIEELFRARDPWYSEVADVVLEGGRGGVGGMVDRLYALLEQVHEQRGWAAETPCTLAEAAPAGLAAAHADAAPAADGTS